MLPSSEYAVSIVNLFANVNKVDIFCGIILIPLACSSFRCTLSLYYQCVYVHSITAAQSEWACNKHLNNRAAYHHIEVYNLAASPH